MTRLVVSIDWRTAGHCNYPGGQLYLLDLEGHKILDHFTGALEPQGLMQPGGWSGFRGVCCTQSYRIMVADVHALREFCVGNNKIRHVISWLTPAWDIHDIYTGQDESIWIAATGQDGLMRLRSFALDGVQTYLTEQLAVWNGRQDDILLAAMTIRNGSPYQPASLLDNWHINSVALWDQEIWCLLNGPGLLVKALPAPSMTMSVEAGQGAHSLRLSRDGLLLYLDTLGQRLMVVDRLGTTVRAVPIAARGDVTDISVASAAARKGWTRGLCILSDELAICGSSPAQLFVVDYQRGEIMDHLMLDESDVRASIFGICAVRA